MPNRTRRIMFTSLVGIVQRGSATLGTLVIFPYVLHRIGTAGFALWGVAASLFMIINFADFGLGPMIINGIARDLATNDQAAARRRFGAALTVAIGIAVMLALAAATVYAISGRDIPAEVYAIIALGIGLNVPLGIANPMWIGMQRGWVMALWEFVQVLLLVGGLYLCGLWSTDVRLFAAVIYLALLVANTFNMASLLLNFPAMRPSTLPASRSDILPIVAPSAKFFALTSLDALTYLFDVTIVLLAAGATAAAQMTVIQRMAVAVTGVMLMLAQYQLPHYVEAWMRRDVHWIRRALGWSLLGSALLALCLGVSLGTIGPALCRFWLGRDIGFHAATFGWLAVWTFALGTARLLSMVLNAMNVLGFQIAAYTAFIVISFALKLVLPRWFGVDGVLLGIIIPAAVFLIPLLGTKVWWQMNRLRSAGE